MKIICPPLPLAGEGLGEGGTFRLPPHLNPRPLPGARTFLLSGNLNLGNWDLFAIWCLIFGACYPLKDLGVHANSKQLR